nr:hypothetical protein Iba_chr11eCG11640 [Ipomoea batatas]
MLLRPVVAISLRFWQMIGTMVKLTVSSRKRESRGWNPMRFPMVSHYLQAMLPRTANRQPRFWPPRIALVIVMFLSQMLGVVVEPMLLIGIKQSPVAPPNQHPLVTEMFGELYFREIITPATSPSSSTSHHHHPFPSVLINTCPINDTIQKD